MGSMPCKWPEGRVFIRCAKYTGYFSVFNDHPAPLYTHWVEAKSAEKGLKTRLNGIGVNTLVW
jgi:hypothetical protein